MDPCLIYWQICKLTTFAKHLQPPFVARLRKSALVCIKGLRFRDMAFRQYL